MATAHHGTTFAALVAAGAVSSMSAISADLPSGDAVGYGNVEIGFAGNSTTDMANNSDIVALNTTLQVPRTPAKTGLLYIWPGLQPWGANFKPIDNGVLQPVLTWGHTFCIKQKQPPPFSTWWISAQYVNIYGHKFPECSGGPVVTAKRGDHLTITMALSGTIWTQTVSNLETGKSVGFDIDLRGQSQNYAYFRIEPYDARSIPAATFSHTTITFSRADAGNCDVRARGARDAVSIPLSIDGGRQCYIDEITLKAAPRPSVCPQGGMARSKNNDKSSTVTFKNRHGAPVTVFWLNFVGAREAFAVLKDGESYTVLTHRSHPWIVMDQSSRCIDSLVPDADSVEHVIH